MEAKASTWEGACDHLEKCLRGHVGALQTFLTVLEVEDEDVLEDVRAWFGALHEALSSISLAMSDAEWVPSVNLAFFPIPWDPPTAPPCRICGMLCMRPARSRMESRDTHTRSCILRCCHASSAPDLRAEHRALQVMDSALKNLEFLANRRFPTNTGRRHASRHAQRRLSHLQNYSKTPRSHRKKCINQLQPGRQEFDEHLRQSYWRLRNMADLAAQATEAMAAYHGSLEILGRDVLTDNLVHKASILSNGGLTTKAAGCLVQFLQNDPSDPDILQKQIRAEIRPSTSDEQPEGRERTPASTLAEVHAGHDVSSAASR